MIDAIGQNLRVVEFAQPRIRVVANIQNFIQYFLSENPAATAFYPDCTKTQMIFLHS